MSSGALDVGTHAPCYVLRLLLAHLFDKLGRSANYEASGWEFFTLGYEGAGGYYRSFAYPGTVQDCAAHPDEAPVSDLAPVYDRAMPDHAIGAHYRRVPRIRVQYTAVLNVRTRPYPDDLRVPA